MFQSSCRSLDPMILEELFTFPTVQRGKSRGDSALAIPTFFSLERGKCQSFLHLFFHMGIAHMEITLISPCNKFTNQLADETDENSVTKFLIMLTKM